MGQPEPAGGPRADEEGPSGSQDLRHPGAAGSHIKAENGVGGTWAGSGGEKKRDLRLVPAGRVLGLKAAAVLDFGLVLAIAGMQRGLREIRWQLYR